jgi:hypothetical protein
MPVTKLIFAVNNITHRCIEEYFRNVGRLFTEAKTMVYKVDSEFALEPNTTYVFFSAIPAKFTNWDENSHKQIILVNVDQLSQKNGYGDRVNHIKQCIAKKIRVLTHGVSYRSESITTKMPHFPTVIDEVESAELKKMIESKPFEYDFVVCGGQTPHRVSRIKRLEEQGLKILFLNNDWGVARDRKIASAKILINLHAFDDYHTYESVRCDRWLGAGKLILSEPCCPESYHGSDQFMHIAEFESMAQIAKDLLANFEFNQQNLLSKMNLLTELNSKKKQQCFDILAEIPVDKFNISIRYGADNQLVDHTEVSMAKKVGGLIIIPPGNQNRKLFFEDKSTDKLDRNVSITLNGETNIYNNTYAIHIKVTNDKVENIDAFVPETKLDSLHDKIKFKGNIKIEVPEQIMATIYIRPDAKVLELGSNIGRNTCIISSLLSKTENLITMETIHETFVRLEENRLMNNFQFKSVNAALSYKPLIQTGWDSKPQDSDVIPDGYCQIATKTYEEVESENKIKFDTIVADCEGALYYIFQDNPHLLDNINTIIMENDYHELPKKRFVDEVLTSKGLRRTYVRSGGWGPCYNIFYEVWQKFD